MKKNMKKNFDSLEERLWCALSKTDLEKIRYELSKINEPTLISGVGGSSVVSCYASKVLNNTNKIITKNIEPRDFKYFNLDGFKNVIACSYSGNNYGTQLAFNNNLKHYLLSSNKPNSDDIVSLRYETNGDKEKSFISLSSTIFLFYYTMCYFIRLL